MVELYCKVTIGYNPSAASRGRWNHIQASRVASVLCHANYTERPWAVVPSRHQTSRIASVLLRADYTERRPSEWL